MRATSPKRSDETISLFPLIGGEGRRELAKLLDHYKVKVQSSTAKDKVRRVSMSSRRSSISKNSIADLVQDVMKQDELAQSVKSRIIHTNRIEHITCKEPWTRTPEDLETLRAEIFKIPSCQKLELTDAAQREISRFATLHKYEPGACVIKQGECADAFYILLDGTMKVMSTTKGVISEMYAGDTFGEGGLLDESHMRKMSVLAQEYNVAVLRIDKAHYDRYIKSFHAKEKARRESVFREVAILEDLSRENKNALLYTMVTARFKIGELLVSEGSFCTSLMFISSGHCRVTKRVAGPRGDPDEEVELGTFYSGACVAVEATLGRARCTYTVTAMSLVVAETLDTAFHIFCDHPILDERTQFLLRAAERDFFQRPQTQAALFNADSLRRWRDYKERLSDHIIRRRRRELRRDAERFSRSLDAAAGNSAEATAAPRRRGDCPPELEGAAGPSETRPPARDGRWPFLQPLVDRSVAARRIAALWSDTVLLKDHTFV